MLHFISTLTLALCAVAAPAGPALVRRQETTICGGNSYTSEETAAASEEGCRLYWLGQQVGRNHYPHNFNNNERLAFPVTGPYQEFPILGDRLYAGGAPGADRIVFRPGEEEDVCDYVGAITHTGAGGNRFVLCQVAEEEAST